MKSKAKSTEGCATLFEIDVSERMIARAFEEVYDEITKMANIPGFRPGKAPKELVEKHYAAHARGEVLKRLIPETYRKALEEHKVTPIGEPAISDVAFDAEGSLTFKARVDTRPKFKLKNYKALNLERKRVEITSEDVAKTLESLREINAKYINIEDRAVRMGDYVVSDLECFVDGKSIHKKRESLWLTVENESFIPGLSEKMIGMKKGEERDIDVTLPEKYPDKNVAGKHARYRVLAKEIKERSLPNIDDEFAKDMGRDNLEDLRGEIAKELTARAKAGAEIDVENHLLNKLMDDNIFSVPSGLLARQLDYMVEDAKHRLLEKGFRKEELDKKDAEFKEKFKNDAVRQVRLLFILDEIAASEGIKAANADLEDTYKSIAAQTGKTEEAIKERYEKEDLVNNLLDKIREAKTVKFLMDNANITEKK